MPEKKDRDTQRTLVVLLRFPDAEARQTFGQWLSRCGRRWGCTCLNFWPIESDAPLDWKRFRGIGGEQASTDANVHR